MSVTRTYHCAATGRKFEVEQRITDDSVPECHECADEQCVPKRIINCEGSIHFRSGDSGGWASSGYSKSEPERRAEYTLGRKLTKSEK